MDRNRCGIRRVSKWWIGLVSNHIPGPGHGIGVVAHVGGNCIEDARTLMAAAADLDFQAAGALMP